MMEARALSLLQGNGVSFMGLVIYKQYDIQDLLQNDTGWGQGWGQAASAWGCQ